jgi:hypothetical protein
VIWAKTEAGRAEIQIRARLKDRHLRALLVLVDGRTAEDALLQSLPGSSPEDLEKLRELGLITPVANARADSPPASPSASQPSSSSTGISSAEFAELALKLKKIISAHLGLGGRALTLALDQAKSVDELAHVARRTIEQIQGRHGPQAAALARDALKRVLGDQD